MPTLSTVLLSIKGEVRRANLQLTDASELTLDSLQKYFKKKDVPQQICHYDYDNKVIFVFGYKKGKKGTENKVELPDPYLDAEIFGDAIVIVSTSHKWQTPVPFTVEQWNTFYSGSGDNADDEDEDDDEDDDEDEEEEKEDDESVKDDFEESDTEKNSIINTDEDEEEEEALPPVRRRRVATYNKVETGPVKEDITLTSEPETNKLRTLCLNNLKFLENTFSAEDIRSLEKGIFEATYNYALKNHLPRSWKSSIFTEIYRQVVRSVFSNIHPKSPVNNPRLLNRVLDGEFPLKDIASMNAYEMFPEKWFALKDKLLQREQKILEGNKSRATDQFKCRRCQKRECTYYELQTRSADEPMTIFITCLNCGKEWRQGG